MLNDPNLLAWILIIGMIVLLYPVTFILLISGKIKSPLSNIFDAANDIILDHLQMGLFVFMVSSAICFAVFMMYIMIVGTAVWLEIIPEQKNLLSDFLAYLILAIQVLGQIYAYYLVVKDIWIASASPRNDGMK